MEKFEDKQTRWEGLWYHQDGKYFSSAAINLSKLKNFKGTIRFYVRKNKYYNNGENGRPNYIFCIRDSKSDYEHEIEIKDVKDGERLYTAEEVKACIHGACEDGRRGYDPFDLLISDYLE